MKNSDRRNAAERPPQRPDYAHAIETAYRGYLFRSRLEAKWAAFFDLCGWPWSYEPKDLGGWIPDFAIGEHPVLVEIKPFWRDDEWGDAKEKIMASGCNEPVLLLGNDPTWRMKSFSVSLETNAPSFGLLFGELDDGTHVIDDWFEDEVYFGFTEGNGKYGLCPLDGAWWNLIWKPPADYHHPNKWSRVHSFGATERTANTCVEDEIERMWAQACNASRWMKHERD